MIDGNPATTAKPTVSLLIVAYNAGSILDECLTAALREATSVGGEVLFIDNGDDGTEHRVAREYPDVRIVPSEGNIGFGPGNNRLAAQARADLLLLVNPDAILDEGAVAVLLEEERRHPEAAVFGGMIKNPEGRPEIHNYIRLPAFSHLLLATAGVEGRIQQRDRPLDRTSAVDAVTGAFFMIRAEAYRAMAGFDESFFLYSEEIDLFHRLGRAGYTILFAPQAAVIHKTGTTGEMSRGRTVYRAIGQMHYMRKHWGPLGAAAGGALVWIAAIERVIAGKLVRNRNSRFARMGHVNWPLVRSPGLWWHGYARGAEHARQAIARLQGN
ncbi:glycosyltransferase family 2 protein [Novosphingobium sp. 9]|uniref:glycosyltransferase family 2 protein n=1 Tax=Novosphingobium sp. 9 TaxID=2025349 RepID=UPI0021B5DB44|nr:glycosyltransferase family 2 protein [Novosphingobium sp. 9]